MLIPIFSRPVAIVFMISLFGNCLMAQQRDSLNSGPEPQGGVSKLALHYFKISFTKAQRELLNGNELELIYSLTEKGKAVLEKVNGITDAAIIDSLYRTTAQLPLFKPEIAEGKAVNSMYFMMLRFPHYGNVPQVNIDEKPLPDRPEDFKHLELGHSFDILFGGVANSYFGSANRYLKTGGGIKMDILFKGQGKFGMGMDIGFYGNRLKKEYSIASTREQATTPATLVIGLAFQWTVISEAKRQLVMQVETNYVVQNIVPREDNYDRDWVQFQGFSPGAMAHYMIKLGGDRVRSHYRYGSPVIVSHWLNAHAGIRPVWYNHSEANGIMLEAGLSYRMRTHSIKSYQLKP